MADKKYIVLRASDGRIPTIDNLGMNGRRAGQPAAYSLPPTASALEIELSEIDIDKAELYDLRRDPGTRAIAPAMPLKLIEPQLINETPNPGASGTAWGIEAVGAVASGFDGSGITVAVLDTGIDPDNTS